MLPPPLRIGILFWLGAFLCSPSPFRPLKFPRLRNHPTGWILRPRTRRRKGVRAHSCARRPDPAVGMPTHLPSVRFSSTLSLLYEGDAWINRGCSSQCAHSTLLGTFFLGRISTMIQNFERTVPCYNHIVPPYITPTNSRPMLYVFLPATGRAQKDRVRIPLPSLDPPKSDAKQTDQSNISTFDPRIRSVQCSQKGPALDPTAGPMFIPTFTNPF